MSRKAPNHYSIDTCLALYFRIVRDNKRTAKLEDMIPETSLYEYSSGMSGRFRTGAADTRDTYEDKECIHLFLAIFDFVLIDLSYGFVQCRPSISGIVNVEILLVARALSRNAQVITQHNVSEVANKLRYSPLQRGHTSQSLWTFAAYR